MDLETKVGQLFFVGFDGTADSPALRDYLAAVRPGGVILFARNIVDADQVRALNETVRARLDPVPFISVDQEGGRVSRLRALLPPLPTAAELARSEAASLRDYARALGDALAALGFNSDFAPVVDLSAPGAVNGIGDRSFGEDATAVVPYARAFIGGLTDAGIAPWIKHFPGLGATDLDSHIGLPVCSREETEMWARDLLPFRELGAEAAGTMIAHVHCPFWDPGEPVAASLSEAVVTGLLRERMAYDGIALTDDLEMGAVLGPSAGELARRALLAGNDMVMFCNSEEKARAAFEAVLSDARDGRLDAARLDRSVERILAAKRRFGIEPQEAARSPVLWDKALAALRSKASSV